MSNNDFSNVNIDLIYKSMTRAVSIAQELSYSLERADMSDEVELVREQARCCLRTLACIQNAAELSVYDSGKINSVEFNLSLFVKDLVNSARSRLRNSKVTLKHQIENQVFVVADSERFAACFMNLIVNSLQNVNRDDGEITVTVKKHFDAAVITVADNGYSMSKEELENFTKRDGAAGGFEILKRFCQSVGIEPVFGGTKNDGFSVTLKIPLAPSYKDNDSSMSSDYVPPKLGTLSPSLLLIYKFDESSVVL